MDIEERAIGRDYFIKLYRRTSRNSEIADFYEHLFEETENETFKQRSEALNLCLKWWDTEFYRQQKVKDIKRVNLCRDKFCLNCQCMLASKRQLKYEPLLNALLSQYDILHTVVTVTNPTAERFPAVLDCMYSRFGYLVRYLRGNAKVKGIDFLQYGFGGGIRALEVTYNAADKTFHPHFHCMLLFRKGLRLERKIINDFSFDRNGKKPVRKFSELEVLLQKIWYLLMNGVKVTREAVDALPLGYSVIMDNAEGHYHEAFKYSCKGAFDEDKGAFVYSEEVFRILRKALYNRRMIQGYGALRCCNDDDQEIFENELQELYEDMLRKLQAVEKPVTKIESFEEVLQARDCRYISKTNMRRVLMSEQGETRGNAI